MLDHVVQLSDSVEVDFGAAAGGPAGRDTVLLLDGTLADLGLNDILVTWGLEPPLRSGALVGLPARRGDVADRAVQESTLARLHAANLNR